MSASEATTAAVATYLTAIRSQAVRVLAQTDREASSPTFGCLDRTHWAWKFIDFPGARFQEGTCVLAFLYATPFDGNPYYGNEKLRDWLAGAIDFWCRIQRKAGDYDEAYPFERSLAATSFTSFYVSEAVALAGEHLPAATKARFEAALARAGHWLTRNDETHGFLTNHRAAAAVALYHAYRVSGESRFEKRGRAIIDGILEHQSSEGWYDEYGGADPGYQTHGSFYLVRYFEMSGDEDVARSVEQSFEFLSQFIHLDLSLGGEYASRNTQTYYPAAFEMMKGRGACASWVAQTMLPAIESASAAGLATVDAYNFFPLLNNYVFAYLGAVRNADRTVAPEGPSLEPTTIDFPKAGLLKVRKPGYDAIVGYGKGGVVKVFDRARHSLVFSNCGYVGKLRSGKIISSQWREDHPRAKLEGDAITIDSTFHEVSRPVMTPLRLLALRVFGLTLGRAPSLARLLKAILVKVLIYRSNTLDLHLTRRIAFREHGVDVDDFLKGSIGADVEQLAGSEAFATIHMGSSRYFVPHELTSSRSDADDFDRPIEATTLAAGVRRRRSIVLGDTGSGAVGPAAGSAGAGSSRSAGSTGAQVGGPGSDARGVSGKRHEGE